MNRYFSLRVRGLLVFTLLFLSLGIIVDLAWGWAVALGFAIGTLLVTLCCVLTYYCRAPFHFNNIADTNQSAFVAFFTNRRIPQHRPRRSVQEEAFVPFKFASPRDPRHEEMVVRAILRQVFSDE